MACCRGARDRRRSRRQQGARPRFAVAIRRPRWRRRRRAPNDETSAERGEPRSLSDDHQLRSTCRGEPSAVRPHPPVDAHHQGRLHAELTLPARIPLLIIDEVGYIPFEAEAANLFFQLVSSRYERASVIVTSNKPFGRWGEVFGDATVAAAMIDRLVHHAEVIALKGDSYRLKDRDLGRVPTDDAQ
jgi:IstB-like ATP binding protein